MVSIVIGMLLIAAMATLIANQSATRVEIDNVVASMPLEAKVADNATDLRQARAK